MLRLSLLTGVVLGSVTLLAPAQTTDKDKPKDARSDRLPVPGEGPAAAAPKKAEGPPEFDIAFADGSNIRVVMIEPSLAVNTRYGKLQIPMTEVRSASLGFRYPEGVEKKVEDAVAKLGADAFKDREEAEAALAGFKEFALPALRVAAKTGEPEVVRRAESLIKKITEKLPEEVLALKDEDTIETARFTIRGRLETTTLKVKSKQFGESALKLDDARTLRSLFTGGGRTDLTLDAAKHARQGWTAWMDTGIDVSTDAPLKISCSGKIDQWTQTPGQYTAGPAGGGGIAPGAPEGFQNGFGPGGRQPGGFPGQPGFVQLRSGAVIGRIGTGGRPFVVGEKFEQSKAPASGRLYLIIAPSNWGNDSSGNYKVSVQVGD